MYFSFNYNPKVKKKTLRLTSKKTNLKKLLKIGHGTDLRRSPHELDDDKITLSASLHKASQQGKNGLIVDLY